MRLPESAYNKEESFQEELMLTIWWVGIGTTLINIIMMASR